MPRRLLLVALLAFGFQTPVFAQTAPSAVSAEVLGLAPQLVDFAGSQANFQSLVNGLAGGVPVTLVTPLADGTTQTTTFTPNGTLSAVQIAQTLEAARQQLISRGVAAPTAEQIGVTLAGGSLPTFAGNIQVTGLVPVTSGTTSASTAAPAAALSPAAVARNAAAAAVPAPLGAAPAPADTSASTGTSGTSVTTTTGAGIAPRRFTSDTPTLHNTSETPVPSIGAAPTPGAPNGLPSPAAQIQQRR